MNVYKYRARDKDGKLVEGSLESVNEKQAVSILRGKGLIVINLNIESESDLANMLSKWRKPSLDDIANFTRQLATMVEAGLPLVDALRILKNQSNARLGIVIEKILISVEGGESLAQSIEEAEGGFSPVYVALVRVGESAGVLDQVLKKMAATLEAEKEFRGKTKGAMVYPAIVMAGMVVVATIMMIFVIPKMTSMYKDMGIELPFLTQVLINISDFFVNFWYLLFILVALVIFGFWRWAKTEVGALLIEQVEFKLPIWGQLKKDMILSKFARTMGLLVSAGVSVLEALRIVGDTLGSRIYGDGIKKTATRVEKGINLADSLSVVEQFPPVLPQMVAVGEQTGKIDDVLTRLAVYYESESATKVKALTTAIEPLMMIVMGVGVGLLVAAVIMPIYHLTSQF